MKSIKRKKQMMTTGEVMKKLTENSEYLQEKMKEGTAKLPQKKMEEFCGRTTGAEMMPCDVPGVLPIEVL